MRVGLDLPVLTATSREAVLAYARAAESLGFDSLWSNSHTVVPVTFAPRYPYSADGRPIWNATSSWPDAMTTMAFVAAATERVRLGIAVVPLITTHPIRLAKQVATIDVLSKGRFELGVGGGWLVEEAQARGQGLDDGGVVFFREQRQKFMAATGVVASSFFLLGIVLGDMPVAFIEACHA